MKTENSHFSNWLKTMRYFKVAFAILVSFAPFHSAADTVLNQGEALFVEHCAKCHGVDAQGNGHSAAGLRTRPPDLTKIAARRSGVWPMLEVMSILNGYLKVTNPREDMPIIAQLNDGPTVDFDTGNGLVTSVPANLISITEYLESIQSPKPERYVP